MSEFAEQGQESVQFSLGQILCGLCGDLGGQGQSGCDEVLSGGCERDVEASEVGFRDGSGDPALLREAVDDAFGGCGVHADLPAQVVLREGSCLVEPCENGELGGGRIRHHAGEKL